MTSTQLTTFLVDGHLFGIEVESVQEVIRHQPMTRVPLAPAAVGGLINLRGQVIAAIDLRHRLGLAARGQDQLPMNVVVRTEDGPVSLLVDQIGAVVDAADEDFELPPDTVVGPTRALLRGAYKLEAQLLLALDVASVVSGPPSSRPDQAVPSTKGTARHGHQPS